MKFLFLVQGEGRGHLTQAISMSQLLAEAGHEVSAVLVGMAADREIPSFFAEQISAPIQTFRSPNLVFNKSGELSLARTVGYPLCRIGRYLRSLRQIDQAVRQYSPDAIVNFYEALGGFYNLLYRPSVPIACVGHQYLFSHSDFQFPARRWLDRFLLQINTKITAMGAKKLLALSFREMPNEAQKRIFVMPPLLRKEIKDLKTSEQGFLLVYVNYPHLVAQIKAWHVQNPSVALHCFWDNKETQANETVIDQTLTFHRLNGEKFLRMMANCRALVTTAGFESVCEAMYLGKPALMVPAHFEQSCNALDAVAAGAGLGATSFDLSAFMEYLPQHQPVGEEFRQWHNQHSIQLVRQLESLNKPKPNSVWRNISWPSRVRPRRAGWRLNQTA